MQIHAIMYVNRPYLNQVFKHIDMAYWTISENIAFEWFILGKVMQKIFCKYIILQHVKCFFETYYGKNAYVFVSITIKAEWLILCCFNIDLI